MNQTTRGLRILTRAPDEAFPNRGSVASYRPIIRATRHHEPTKASERSRVDFRHPARALRRRWRLLALATVLGIAISTALTLTATPTYVAATQLFVSTSAGAANGTASLNQGGQFAQQRVKSYAAIMNKPIVTRAVIEELNLDTTPQRLGTQISANAPFDTVLIDVLVTDTSAPRAAAIANAVAERFALVVDEVETPDSSDTSPVKVSTVLEAVPPSEPVSPRPLLNVLAGLVGGLVLGALLALLRENLDQTVRVPEEVDVLLGVPAIGSIPRNPRAKGRPLTTSHDGASLQAEGFRQLRTNLQFLDVDRPPRSFVITSAVAEEGKTATSANLALALVDAGVRVILVEADLRRPKLHDYLGLSNAIGLTDAIVGRCQVDEVLQPWGDGGLRVLASGQLPPNPSELLGSQQMVDVLRNLEARCDLVLIDTPPLLPVTDASVLAATADGVIVVVRAGHTRRERVTRALGLLESVGAQVLGVVLNMVREDGQDGYRYQAEVSSANGSPPKAAFAAGRATDPEARAGAPSALQARG